MYECIAEGGESAVLVSGARGKPAPDHYKVHNPLYLSNPYMTLGHYIHEYSSPPQFYFRSPDPHPKKDFFIPALGLGELCCHNHNGLIFRG